MKKVVSILLLIALVFSCSASVFAANGGAATGVTSQMCSADYWVNLAKKNSKFGGTKALLSLDEIAELNKTVKASKGTHMVNFDKFDEPYDADAIRKELANIDIPSYDVYINGKQVNKNSYFASISNAIKNTGFTSKSKQALYAVATEYADIKAVPVKEFICDSLTDTADEMQSASLLVGEPFVITQKCEYKGVKFYYGHSSIVSGWVEASKLAICESKEQWLDAWRITDNTAKDFIVICDDKIALENSIDKTYPSGLKLMLGTILKLVPDEEMPEKVAERGTWHNYVVYLPTRDAKGNYVKSTALISEHNNVSVGFVPYTEANVVSLAFSSLGNRYGWGNMLEDLDCSGYVRNIYRCFGIELPRNTSWQPLIDNTRINVKGLSEDDIAKMLKQVPVGSPIYFSGHAMIYLGTVDGVPYCISSAATLADTAESGNDAAVKMLGVMVTPLNVRRANGSTWLSNLSSILVFPEAAKKLRFTDVPAYANYYKALFWCCENDYLLGTSETKFSPNKLLTSESIDIIYKRVYGEGYLLEEANWLNDKMTRAEAAIQIFEHTK